MYTDKMGEPLLTINMYSMHRRTIFSKIEWKKLRETFSWPPPPIINRFSTNTQNSMNNFSVLTVWIMIYCMQIVRTKRQKRSLAFFCVFYEEQHMDAYVVCTQFGREQKKTPHRYLDNHEHIKHRTGFVWKKNRKFMLRKIMIYICFRLFSVGLSLSSEIEYGGRQWNRTHWDKCA